MVKEIKLEEVSSELEVKTRFQRQCPDFAFAFYVFIIRSIIENSHIQARVYFIFAKNLLKQT